MSVIDWMRRPILVRQVAIWAVEVARRCHPEVTIRLGQMMYRMSLAEARGYVRARSAAVLDAEMAIVERQTGCEPAMSAAVRRRAIQELTRLAIGDLLKATRHAVTLRKAA